MQWCGDTHWANRATAIPWGGSGLGGNREIVSAECSPPSDAASLGLVLISSQQNSGQGKKIRCDPWRLIYGPAAVNRNGKRLSLDIVGAVYACVVSVFSLWTGDFSAVYFVWHVVIFVGGTRSGGPVRKKGWGGGKQSQSFSHHKRAVKQCTHTVKITSNSIWMLSQYSRPEYGPA